MVRGLSAVLGAYGLALAYLLVAPHIPAPANPDAAALAAGAAGLVAYGLCALVLVPAHDEAVPLALLALGSGLLAVMLAQTDARPGQDLFKVALTAAVGMLLAHALRGAPAAVIGVPIFVAAVDAWSALSGPTSVLVREHPATADALSFSLPAWRHGAGGAQLGVSDIVFMAFFAASAWRYGLRRILTAALLVASLVATLAVGIAVDRTMPAVPGLALALLLPNLDRIPAVLRAEGAARTGPSPR